MKDGSNSSQAFIAWRLSPGEYACKQVQQPTACISCALVVPDDFENDITLAVSCHQMSENTQRALKECGPSEVNALATEGMRMD